MREFMLEVCTDSVESAAAAVRGGARRLEVCANLVIGGTTPGVSQFKQIRKACDIPLNVLLRPRYGDFLYTEAEFTMLLEDTAMFRKLGADGIVVGCLNADGTLDLERIKKLREAADGMHMTLHRAFDVCRNPKETLEQAVEIGVDTILTSGHKDRCMAGIGLLKQLTEQSAGRIHILAGGGVTPENIGMLAKETGTDSFHMSGKKIIESGMEYRNDEVNMGIPGIGEYEIFRTDEAKIAKAVQELNKLFK
nr:copper homeostasis protein CutC [Lacrimispora amygdalina]